MFRFDPLWRTSYFILFRSSQPTLPNSVIDLLHYRWVTTRILAIRKTLFCFRKFLFNFVIRTRYIQYVRTCVFLAKKQEGGQSFLPVTYYSCLYCNRYLHLPVTNNRPQRRSACIKKRFTPFVSPSERNVPANRKERRRSKQP